MPKEKSFVFSVAVWVAALGYFVDIYDLLLFGIIRKPSLTALGLGIDEILTAGENIISIQMVGLLAGGFLWGIMGDKKGRLSVLFGSILMYSLANIANGFVATVPQYALCRFIAGIGLAGELGAGITLVSELVSIKQRGLATSFVAAVGLTGAVFAYFTKEYVTNWRYCYFLGGGMGLLLLMLRVSVFESGMYGKVKQAKITKGNIGMFFASKERLGRYLKCILTGLPNWYVIGVLISFSDKFAKEMHITGAVDPGRAIMFGYVGISIGDLLIGMISQWWKSRKKALYLYYFFTVLSIALYFTQQNGSSESMYFCCAFAGFSVGFWAIFVTMAAEQFGTNIRATAATTVPNIARGTLPLVILAFKAARNTSLGFIGGAIAVGVVCILIGLAAVILSKETFGKDLDFTEE